MDHTLYETLSTLAQRGSLIVGGFNCIGLHDVHQQTNETRDLSNLVDYNLLIRHAYEQTRVANILNLIMKKSEGMVNNLFNYWRKLCK